MEIPNIEIQENRDSTVPCGKMSSLDYEAGVTTVRSDFFCQGDAIISCSPGCVSITCAYIEPRYF